jgi:anti-sigma B factor antagonist
VPPDESLALSDERIGDATIVRCTGEVDIMTVTLLRDRLTQLQVDGVSRLVVDLHDVTFIDSLGLGALIGAHKRARVLRGSFVILTSSRPVLRVLQATALDRVFTVVATLDEALAD